MSAPRRHPLYDRVADVGAPPLVAWRAALELWMVFVSTIAGLVRALSRESRAARKRTGRGEVARQLHTIGNRSLVFVGVTLGSIGMVMTYQTCLQLGRVTGDYSQVGGQFLRLIVSDFGPTLTGMMLATRVGAGIAAEIGSMKVTEQIDALRMSGVLPIDYLIVPRFVASIVMTLVLSVLGSAVMFAAGGLTAQASFDVNPDTFFDPRQLRWHHLALFVIKSLSYGAAIPIVAGFCGLRARGSSEGVGWATTAAVIGSSFAVIVLDFIISATALFLTGGAP